MQRNDDLAPLIQELIDALVNNTKATYLARRELQTQTRTLEEYMNVLREISPTF